MDFVKVAANIGAARVDAAAQRDVGQMLAADLTHRGSRGGLPIVACHESTDARFGVTKNAAAAAQTVDKLPVSQRQPTEGAILHPGINQESFDISEQGAFPHDAVNTRVASRTSSLNAGSVPMLRDATRIAIIPAVSDAQKIDHAKLKRVLIERTGPGKEFTRRGLSNKATDGKNPDLIRDIMRVSDRKTQFENVAALARALDMDVSEFLIGDKAPGADSDAPPGRVRVQITSIVEAGVWREWDELPPDERYWVTFDDDPVSGQLTGFRVEGRSMELRFPPGTDLKCVILMGSEEIIEPGDYVIVARHRGGLTEKTVKRIERREDGNWELHAESTLPEFRDPIFIGQPDFYAEPEDDIVVTNDEIRVVAKVCEAKQSFVKRRRIAVYTV